MQRFRDYEDSYGVIIRSGWIVNDVSMTVGRSRTVITYRAQLPAPIALLAVATMVEVLQAGWPGSRFRFRYPLPGDPPDVAQATADVRRDYRRAERAARRRLLPASMIEQAEREGWGLGMLQEACGMDAFSVEARVREWRAAGRRIVPLQAFEWDGRIPF